MFTCVKILMLNGQSNKEINCEIDVKLFVPLMVWPDRNHLKTFNNFALLK